MTDNQKVALGFLCGLAAGALAGVLLAPASGVETRKKIANKAKDLKDDLNDQLSSTFGRITDQVSSTLGWAGKESPGDHAARKMAKEGMDV
jgi:gas vesicle protein